MALGQWDVMQSAADICRAQRGEYGLTCRTGLLRRVAPSNASTGRLAMKGALMFTP